jgi:hypothetical protein
MYTFAIYFYDGTYQKFYGDSKKDVLRYFGSINPHAVSEIQNVVRIN